MSFFRRLNGHYNGAASAVPSAIIPVSDIATRDAPAPISPAPAPVFTLPPMNVATFSPTNVQQPIFPPISFRPPITSIAPIPIMGTVATAAAAQVLAHPVIQRSLDVAMAKQRAADASQANADAVAQTGADAAAHQAAADAKQAAADAAAHQAAADVNNVIDSGGGLQYHDPYGRDYGGEALPPGTAPAGDPTPDPTGYGNSGASGLLKRHPYVATGGAAGVGFLLGGPIGGLVGAAIGWFTSRS